MNTRLFLRSAAVVTLLLGAGHMLGRPWAPVHQPGALAVLDAMKSHAMHIMGFDRTFMDFYQGFGLMLGVYLFMQAVMLWLLAMLPTTTPARAMLAVIFAANVLQTLIAWRCLFAVPLVMSLLVAVLLGCALMAWPKPAALRDGAMA